LRFSLRKNTFLAYLLFLSFFLISAFAFISCSSSEETTDKTIQPQAEVKEKLVLPDLTNPVRVLISEKSSDAQIKFTNGIVVKSDGEPVVEINAKNKIGLKAKDGKIELTIGKKSYTRDNFTLLPSTASGSIDFDGKKYPDSIKIISKEDKILLINYVGFDNYVMCVISAEMGNLTKKENLEALKALSLCVKCFVIDNLKESKTNFDVYNDIKDQLFNGIGNINSNVREAYDSTKNLFLTYQNELAQVYYFSSCGGYTENCVNVLPNCSSPYLIGVKDGDEPYCRISPSFSWEETYTKKQIVKFLVDSKYIEEGNWKLKEFSVQSRYASGRISELLIVVENKNGERKEFVLSGNKIRYVIKTNKDGILKSANFDIEAKYINQEIDAVKLKGKGNGHGVGLCQWGAIGQARAGRKFDDILRHYFPGIELTSKE